VSAQADLTLIDNAPLRILKRFRPTREWITAHGDLLYLPPRCAHEGVATGHCMTLSIGFRAPRHQALAAGFLEYLQDELHEWRLDGMYQDAGLPLQAHPAQIPAPMLRQFAAVLKKIHWNAHDIRRFAGRYLTEPKAHTVFRAPRRAASLPAFVRRVATHGVRLALPTRMLFSGHDVFINGDHHHAGTALDAGLVRLADQRALPAFTASGATARLLHAWYRAGYIEV
jgi:50S ribosomal protein L16 3-hydroxylase